MIRSVPEIVAILAVMIMNDKATRIGTNGTIRLTMYDLYTQDSLSTITIILLHVDTFKITFDKTGRKIRWLSQVGVTGGIPIPFSLAVYRYVMSFSQTYK